MRAPRLPPAGPFFIPLEATTFQSRTYGTPKDLHVKIYNSRS
jgi:hypothetical protein